jgi:hypothetical protein
MRILTRGRVLFDCPKEPLPDKLEVLLCLLDGAERRRHLQAKLNRGPTQAATTKTAIRA